MAEKTVLGVSSGEPRQLSQVIQEIVQRIPIYEEKPLIYNGQVTNFKLIIAKEKVVSVVSKYYQLIQSREMFSEFLSQIPFEFEYRVKTNLQKNIVYIRSNEPIVLEYKLMMILINSVDKSNALKILSGVFIKDCANDLLVMKGVYIRHIGNTKYGFNPLNLVEQIRNSIRNMENEYVTIDNDDIEYIKKKFYRWIELEPRKYSKWELYNLLTNPIRKKYNFAYFAKLNAIFNWVIGK